MTCAHDRDANAYVEPVEESAETEAATPAQEINWQEQALSFKDQWMRAVAETENIRKRAIKERDDALKYGVTKFASDVLSIADNMKRALDNCPEKIPQELEGLIGGIKLVEDETKKILERHGVRELNPMGDAFDPNFHQAMLEVPATEGAVPGTIAQVLQVGYMIHDRLLRPALVSVFKA